MADKLRVGIVTPAFFYVPFWAGVRNGQYAAEGLEVEVIDLYSINNVTDALLAGDIEIGVGSPEHVIANVEAGGKLRMVAGNVNRPTHSLIAQPRFKTRADLRGATIGVSALNAGTSSFFFKMLGKAGLHYPADYTLVEAGPVPPRHTALQQGTIDAALQTDPHNYMAEDEGFTNLGAAIDDIPYFQFTSVNVVQDWAEANRDVLVRFLVVTLRNTEAMFADEDAAVAVAMAEMNIPEGYARRAWADHTTGEPVPRDLRVGEASVRTAAEMMRDGRALAFEGEIQPGRYVDQTYLAAAQAAVGLPDARTLG